MLKVDKKLKLIIEDVIDLDTSLFAVVLKTVDIKHEQSITKMSY